MQRVDKVLAAEDPGAHQGKTAEHAAKTVGWSKATLYRYMETYDGAPAPRDAVRPKRPSGRSQYVEKATLPPRD